MLTVCAKPSQLHQAIEQAIEDLLLAGLYEISDATLDSANPRFVLTKKGQRILANQILTGQDMKAIVQAEIRATRGE